MDSPSDADNQIVPVSGVESDKTHEEEPSVDQDEAGTESSESAVEAAAPPAQNQELVNPPDNEYGCRHCVKKFSNKQALGGHQNAHKVERLMEKKLQDHRINLDHIRSSSYYGRSGAGGPDKYRYSPYASWGCTAHHHSGGCSGVIPYISRPLFRAFSGWTAPLFPGRAHYTLPPVQNMNIRLPNFEAGSSNAAAGQGTPPVNAAPINLRNVPEPEEEDEDSDLDLSLKLSYDA